MRDPVRDQLDTIRAISERLLRDHGTVTDQMMRALTPQPSVGGDAPADADVELTGVEAATLRRIRSEASKYQTAIEGALRVLEVADVIRGRHNKADTVKASIELRCDGWVDPTCATNGVKDVWVEGHHHWWCAQCYATHRQRKSREDRQTA